MKNFECLYKMFFKLEKYLKLKNTFRYFQLLILLFVITFVFNVNTNQVNLFLMLKLRTERKINCFSYFCRKKKLFKAQNKN